LKGKKFKVYISDIVFIKAERKINMIKYILLIISLTIVFLELSCNSNPVASEEPGRRDYTWKVDTLTVPNGDLFYLFSLWGSSPTDIWAVGSGSTALVTLWHYDGAHWSRNTSSISSNLMCVYGFSQNDVWVTSSPGGIYHYNGQQWSLAYANSIPGTYPGFDNIWGDASNDVYAVGAIDTISGGYKGEIAHYNGSSWNLVAISDYRVGFNGIKRGVKESNKYYLVGTRFESMGDTSKVFVLDSNSLIEIYSGTKRINVNEINGRIYFTQAGGKQILKYTNSSFQVWKDFSSSDITLGLLWGRNELDIFTQAYKSGIYGLGHYNGTDWTLLYEMKAAISDIAIFEKDIFILSSNRIIIHGQLK
jgi:hypothetical protein